MLGISVYPYKENIEETLSYIKKAADLGYGRIFTNLLEVKEDKEALLATMKKVIGFARELGMEVVLDVNPAVFEQLHISYQNLDFFADMNATGIRLDTSFDGLVESFLTYEHNHLDIEVNISNDTAYVENILRYRPNAKKLIGCHNFYPQRFTGLGYDYFKKCSLKYKKLGLRTAAFINSHEASHGPHPHTDGLCSLEMHRDKPIVVQAKHLVALGCIDDIIIANAFASDAELEAVSRVEQDQIVLDVVFNNSVSPEEKNLVLQEQHINRGDISDYMIRSTFIRLAYKNKSIPANGTQDKVQYGDITIGNDSFGQYRGELNIVLQDMPDKGHYKNVVGRIVEEELFLLSYIKPWTKFRFREFQSK